MQILIFLKRRSLTLAIVFRLWQQVLFGRKFHGAAVEVGSAALGSAANCINTNLQIKLNQIKISVYPDKTSHALNSI